MKSQIAFRETRESMAGQAVWIAVGLAEVGPDFARSAEGRFTNCRMDFSEDGTPLFMLFTGDCRPVTRSGVSAAAELDSCGVDQPLRMRLDRATPSASSNAELFMRLTRVPPSEDGNVVMAFCGMASYPETVRLDCDSVFQLGTVPDYRTDAFRRLEGRLRIEVNREWGEPSMLATMRGEGVSAFLRHPTWGFAEEPVAVRSTLPLATQEKCARHMTLHFKERTRTEESEYLRLDEYMRTTGLASYRDHAEYEETLAILVSSGIAPDSGLPITRNQLAERSSAMSDAIRSVSAARERPPMKPTRYTR